MKGLKFKLNQVLVTSHLRCALKHVKQGAPHGPAISGKRVVRLAGYNLRAEVCPGAAECVRHNQAVFFAVPALLGKTKVGQLGHVVGRVAEQDVVHLDVAVRHVVLFVETLQRQTHLFGTRK